MEYQRRIRDLREDHDLTQRQVAELLGTSQTMYARYERGTNELPIRHLIVLADYYHVTTDYIMGRSSRKTPQTKKDFCPRMAFLPLRGPKRS